MYWVEEEISGTYLKRRSKILNNNSIIIEKLCG